MFDYMVWVDTLLPQLPKSIYVYVYWGLNALYQVTIPINLKMASKLCVDPSPIKVNRDGCMFLSLSHLRILRCPRPEKYS